MAKPKGRRPPPKDHGPRINRRIRVPEVRVIGPDGEQLGVLETREAIRVAEDCELDLVEVNPKASPPVCRIMDYGRYKYEEKKKKSEAKKKQVQTSLKEIKMRPKTDDHDIDFKSRHVRRFLEAGNKVKLTVRFRGREITHPEMAKRQIVRIFENVEEIGVMEMQPRMEGRQMTAIVAPIGNKPSKKKAPKPKKVEAETPKAEVAPEAAKASE